MTRRILELAIAEGRRLSHEQTGLIHHFVHALPGDQAVAIPLTENMLFAVALLRSHIAENVQEAKSLIRRLLNFQGESGNFPVYVHDFPDCHDRSLGATLLIPLQIVINDYGHVLGADLFKKVERSAARLFDYCVSQLDHLPYLASLRVAAVMAHRGDKQKWEELSVVRPEWYSPASLGELLTCFQMVNHDLATFPQLWEFLAKVWHYPTMSYCGPAHREYLLGSTPQQTALDLYMAVLNDRLLPGTQKPHVSHLWGALIFPVNTTLPVPFYPMESTYAGWKGFQTDTYAYTLTSYDDGMDRKANKGFHPFRLIWGSPEHVHSFVCQGGNNQAFEWEVSPDGVLLSFDLAEPVDSDDREKLRETTFYLDLHEGSTILVEGEAATTFQVDEKLQITSGSFIFGVTFQVKEGEAKFFGHIGRGSRPAQLLTKGQHRFDAYDWQLFLRTVRRTPDCRVQCRISI